MKEFYDYRDKYLLQEGVLVSNSRTVSVSSSWIGTDLPATISVRVYENRKLKNVWSSNVDCIYHFSHGKKDYTFKFQNGDTLRMTLRKSKIQEGVVFLTCRCKGMYSGYSDYYSSHFTMLLPEEWKNVVEYVLIAKPKYELDTQQILLEKQK